MQLSKNVVLLFSFLLISTFFLPNISTASDSNFSSTVERPNNYRKFIFTQFYDDFSYLLGQRDFYMMYGGLYASPRIFDEGFETEKNRLGIMWEHSQFADNFFELGEIVGDVTFPAALSVTSWSAGKILGSEKLKNFGYDLIRAQAMNGLVTLSLKGLVHRTRPNGAPYSYPSGHTSSSFATAGVVYSNFGKGLGIPAFALASFVGISRLQENKHYVSDVIAGAIVGTYVSLKLSGHSTSGSSISFAPLDYNGAQGLQIALKF